MFQILVADDEKLMRKGIITMLERGLKEEIVCIEAANGMQALEIAKSQQIDLVITDICMPVLSGLEFIDRLRKVDQNMLVIIISAYENFEYAKQAIQLGVKDYIMKPLHKEELLGLAENCIADVIKKQAELQKKNMEVYQRNLILQEWRTEAVKQILFGTDAGEGVRKLEVIDSGLQEGFFVAALFSYEMIAETDAEFSLIVKSIVDKYFKQEFAGQVYSVVIDRNQLGLFLCSTAVLRKNYIKKHFAKVVYWIEKDCRVRVVVGIGNIVYHTKDISQSFESAKLAADCKIFRTTERVVMYMELPRRELDILDLVDVDENGYKYLIRDERRLLDVFLPLLQEGRSVEVIRLLRKRYQKLSDYYAACCEGKENCEIQSFSMFWSEFELRQEIKRMQQSLCGVLDAQEDQAGAKRLVDDILAFTVEHVTEDIDLNYVAEHFGKTPGYVGTLFRNAKHQKFNEFVTGERVRLAKKLLSDPALSVQEVGKRCGYYNPKYFSVVFKKMEGVSPKTYQMRLKEEGR